MKRLSSCLAAFLCATALSVPETTYAFSWQWVPRVLKFDTTVYRDTSRNGDFGCAVRNSFGTCVMYNRYRRITAINTGNPKNTLNYSYCQYDDYQRKTSDHSTPSDCDFGEPRTYRTR